MGELCERVALEEPAAVIAVVGDAGTFPLRNLGGVMSGNAPSVDNVGV